MKFSVIIPNLNSPVIHKTLEALERQDIEPEQFEVIVVGMDEPGLIEEGERVRFDRSDRPLNPAQARNRGAGQARGEILAFTDADCIPHKNWLSSLADRFAEAPVQIVGGGVEIPCGNYWRLSDNLATFHDYTSYLQAGTRSQLPSLNLALRKEAFQSVGGFDERFPRPAGEDSDLSLRLRQRGYVLHFFPSAAVRHEPLRRSPKDLVSHAFYRGMYSVKMDPRYAKLTGYPRTLQRKPLFLLASPFLAVGAAVRPFLRNPVHLRHAQTLPAILLSKAAWCAGAFFSSSGTFKERNSW